MLKRAPWAVVLVMMFLAPACARSRTALPLPKAHAHNDYRHVRPLLDALDHGFCSVEADIHLVDGALLVAHDRDKVRPGRTLQKLYLDPLRKRARKKGGRIYRDGPPFILLIDVKSDAAATWAALRDVLEDYADILTVFECDRRETKAVTVVISGARDSKTMAAEARRLAGVDGRLSDLDSDVPAHFMPMISDNWRNHFTWNGQGPMPDTEREKLRGIVERAHGKGQVVRFWATPERPALWQELYSAGVDLINTDQLARLQEFLNTNPAE
jgi:Glycerophosphoryl diester phosphodiesterase family